MGCFRVRCYHQENVGASHHQKGCAKHLLEEASKAVQLETDSSWQHESYEEELELSRMGNDLVVLQLLDATSVQGRESSRMGGISGK